MNMAIDYKLRIQLKNLLMQDILLYFWNIVVNSFAQHE